MKKYILLAFLLLMDRPVLSQVYPISPRLDSLRATVLLQLRAASTGTRYLTEAVVNTAVNRGLAATCTRFPALEKFDTVTITKTIEGGALPSDFVRILYAWRIIGTDKRLALTYMEPDSFRVTMKSEGLYEQKKNDDLSPEYYYTYGRKLMQQPKWSKDETDSVLVQYLAVDAQLASDADTTIILPEYLEKVIHYACAILAAGRNNFNESQFFMQMFEYGRPITREGELKK
ncbi:MAG: hypothetical protein P1R58_13470 [bacterium]|nr:hypothetical protein [bacterium]